MEIAELGQRSMNRLVTKNPGQLAQIQSHHWPPVPLQNSLHHTTMLQKDFIETSMN